MTHAQEWLAEHGVTTTIAPRRTDADDLTRALVADAERDEAELCRHDIRLVTPDGEFESQAFRFPDGSAVAVAGGARYHVTNLRLSTGPRVYPDAGPLDAGRRCGDADL